MSSENLEKSISEMLVKDIMTKVLITVEPTTTLFQIAKMMEQSGIGAVIVKKNGNPSGIVTDRDFAIKVATQSLSLDTSVDKIASYPLQTINSSESIVAAADVMATKKIRKLAVVEDEKIVGIITSTDLVNQLASKK
jgi:CBS domain-containing protein